MVTFSLVWCTDRIHSQNKKNRLPRGKCFQMTEKQLPSSVAKHRIGWQALAQLKGRGGGGGSYALVYGWNEKNGVEIWGWVKWGA